MAKKNPSKKYLFTLDIDVDSVSQKYKIDPHPEDILEKESKKSSSKTTTKLTDLNSQQKGTPETISFLDESKRSHVCNVSMIDMTSGKDVVLLKYACFWCRNPFETKGIGCPVRYVPNQIIKKYQSTNKDTYKIREAITQKKCDENDDIQIIQKGYYESDGVFCSFNCCQAFIEDNKHNRMYDDSAYLLMKLYNEYFGTKAVIIKAARSWRMLKSYGGHLNIIQFRDKMNKIDKAKEFFAF